MSPRRVMLRLVELLGAIRDLQECSRELPGTLWGALGELSGSSWGALGASWDALGRLLGAFWVRKSRSVAESLLFRESSSRLHGSIDFEVWRGRKWARNRSLGIKNDVGSGKKRSEGVFGAVQGDQRGPWGLQDGILRPSEAPGRHFGGSKGKDGGVPAGCAGPVFGFLQFEIRRPLLAGEQGVLNNLHLSVIIRSRRLPVAPRISPAK